MNWTYSDLYTLIKSYREIIDTSTINLALDFLETAETIISTPPSISTDTDCIDIEWRGRYSFYVTIYSDYIEFETSPEWETHKTTNIKELKIALIKYKDHKTVFDVL